MTAPRTDSQDSQTVSAVVTAAARAAAALVPATVALVPGDPGQRPRPRPAAPRRRLGGRRPGSPARSAATWSW